MFGERLRKANCVAARRLNRRRNLRPYWYSTGLHADYLNRKLQEFGYYRKFHDLDCCPEAPQCTWCRQPSKTKGWWKKRNFWFRDIDEWFAWHAAFPVTPDGESDSEEPHVW